MNLDFQGRLHPSNFFFLVRFPDEQANREHKTYVWDEAAGRYRTGPDREDTFVFKWAMARETRDLSLSAEQSYKADIWFWKANRTDPEGYADDKIQRYTRGKLPKSKQMLSANGQVFYLQREGDEGEAAYRVTSYSERQKDRMPKFILSAPGGSRADIQAKGVWKDGFWTVELARQLDTGHSDDVQFVTSGSYLFAVSRYEIAGRKPNPALQQPLFGAGEVGEHLLLTFDRAP